MSLSEAEVQSARGAWEKIYVDAEDNGTAVLIRMFTEHPDTKSYFTHFKGMDSAEEMKQSDQVRGHGKKVFSTINDMVQHLDNSEAFLGIVTPLGKKHATQLKIDPKNFRNLTKMTVIDQRMFTEHPDTKSYFTHFKGMDSAEEMKQSDQVRGHGKKVFSTINDMVQHLDNSEAFLGIVTPLGKKHATQLKIDPKNFRIICDIILQLMEEKFGGDSKASFEKVTNEICTHLNNIYKEEGWTSTGFRSGSVKLKKFNKAKCKVLHLGQGNPKYKSRLKDKQLESSPAEKDLEWMRSWT
ncbi:hypothetical protein HGM15179_012031 [Zosterops borbonicus]|uniref:superoxide dismutase n=1 Tax=Zosterops borbonicus TaxID=364589 RepID=A0A8K1GAI7_9PASS|nr:hypothetical protein HGM15179_012031 [Zosterops borbonicus]